MEQAVKYYSAAAELGLAKAQFNLGNMLTCTCTVFMLYILCFALF